MINFLNKDKQLIERLNDLAQHAVDGNLLYTAAARHALSEDLFMIFDRYATEHNRFVFELQRLIVDFDGELSLQVDTPIDRATTSNDAYWLSRCMNHEMKTLSAYDEALDEHNPVHVYGFLRDHRGKVLDAYETLSRLFRTHKYWSA